MLLIDGADAVAEGMFEQLRYLVDAARNAGVVVVAITAADNKQVVRDTLAERFGDDVVELLVPVLTDAEVDEVLASSLSWPTLPRTRARASCFGGPWSSICSCAAASPACRSVTPTPCTRCGRLGSSS